MLHYDSMQFGYFKISGISSDKKLIHSHSCCKTSIQTGLLRTQQLHW